MSWGTKFYTPPTAWSPTIGDGSNNFTLSTQSGYYEVTGNIVRCDIHLIWSSKGSASAAATARVSLPFAIASTTPRLCGFFGAFTMLQYVDQITIFGDSGGSVFYFSDNTSAGGNSNLIVSDFGATGELQISLSYTK